MHWLTCYPSQGYEAMSVTVNMFWKALKSGNTSLSSFCPILPSLLSSFTPFLLSSLFLLSFLSPFLLSVLPYLSFSIYEELNVCQALDWVRTAGQLCQYDPVPILEEPTVRSSQTRKSTGLALGEQTKMGEPGGPKLAWELGCQGRLPRGGVRACFGNA